MTMTEQIKQGSAKVDMYGHPFAAGSIGDLCIIRASHTSMYMHTHVHTKLTLLHLSRASIVSLVFFSAVKRALQGLVSSSLLELYHQTEMALCPYLDKQGVCVCVCVRVHVMCDDIKVYLCTWSWKHNDYSALLRKD